jgi:malonyl CoA-acyl carrier protein transacylase
MKKRNALAATAIPAMLVPALLLVFIPVTTHMAQAKGSVFGLNPQFWAGFMMGLGAVLSLATVVSILVKLRSE